MKKNKKIKKSKIKKSKKIKRRQIVHIKTFFIELIFFIRKLNFLVFYIKVLNNNKIRIK